MYSFVYIEFIELNSFLFLGMEMERIGAELIPLVKDYHNSQLRAFTGVQSINLNRFASSRHYIVSLIYI